MTNRYGGFRTRNVFSSWINRVSESAKNIAPPISIQDIDYSTLQGIWNLRSTTQFPKQTLSNISFVTSTSATNAGSITIPTSAREGDLAVLFDYSSTNTGNTIHPGWNLIVRTFTTLNAICSYKILVAQDIGTSVTGLTSSASKTILIFRPNRPLLLVIAGSVNGQTTTVAPSNQTLGVPSASSPIIGFAHYTSSGSITSAASSFSMNTVLNTNTQVCKYVILNKGSASVNSTISMGDHGTNLMQSFYLKLE